MGGRDGGVRGAWGRVEWHGRVLPQSECALKAQMVTMTGGEGWGGWTDLRKR